MRLTRRTLAALALAGLVACGDDEPPPAPALTHFRGVNLAGAEFGENNLPGEFGKDYTYPTAEEAAYFAGKGMNLVRLPFRWERLQPALNEDFDAAELAHLTRFVAAAKANGMTVILDLHNFARHRGAVIGQGEATIAHFADFWGRLAARFADEPLVAFGLMNEPNNMSSEDRLEIANAGLAAIREAGADNLVLVPGNGWSYAHAWFQDWYGTPNAEVMLMLVDPADNFVIEIHQYFDRETRGVEPTCEYAASALVSEFTAWARSKGLRAVLGEFAGGDNANCRVAITDLLRHLGANNDVWLGWAWWAAGPWWGDYMFSLEPRGATDAPQLAWLRPYLR